MAPFGRPSGSGCFAAYHHMLPKFTLKLQYSFASIIHNRKNVIQLQQYKSTQNKLLQKSHSTFLRQDVLKLIQLYYVHTLGLKMFAQGGLFMK